MRYVSTRGAASGAGLPFCDILLDGLAPDGGLYLPESYPALSAETLDRWQALLASEGLSLTDVVKATVFATSMNDFAAVNGVYATYFEKEPPARSFVEVSALPKGALVEIEVVAWKE